MRPVNCSVLGAFPNESEQCTPVNNYPKKPRVSLDFLVPTFTYPIWNYIGGWNWYTEAMNTQEVDALAKIIWDYHHMNDVLLKSDCIFVLCSMDTRVAERAVVRGA